MYKKLLILGIVLFALSSILTILRAALPNDVGFGNHLDLIYIYSVPSKVALILGFILLMAFLSGIIWRLAIILILVAILWWSWSQSRIGREPFDLNAGAQFLVQERANV